MYYTLKRFLRLFAILPNWISLFYIGMCSFFTFAHFASLALPILFGTIVSEISEMSSNMMYLWLYIVLFAISLVIRKGFSLANITVRAYAEQHISINLFRSCVHNEEDDLTLFRRDLHMVSQLFLDMVFSFPAQFIGYFAIHFYVAIEEPLIALIQVVCVFVFILIAHFRDRIITTAYENSQKDEKAHFEVNESIISANIDIILSDSILWARNKISDSFDKFYRSKYRYIVLKNVFDIVGELFTVIVHRVCVLLAFIGYGNNQLSLAATITVVTYLEFLNNALQQLSSDLVRLLDYKIHLQRIHHTLDISQNTINNYVETVETNNHLSCLLHDLSITRGECKINGLSCVLTSGRITAISAPSGTGKSTLLDALANRMEISEGKIEVRKGTRISYLEQNPSMLNRSIRDNLLIAHPSANDEELLNILTIVGLRDFIDMLPKGLDSSIGDRGYSISGGERSRLGLARVLLFDADIYLLDEPLIGVDIETKYNIMSSVKTMLASKICVLASHDEEMLKFADDIILLESFMLTRR